MEGEALKPLIMQAGAAFWSAASLLLLGSHQPLYAQHMNAPDAPCQEAGSMADTSNCMVAALKQADMDLNGAYRAIMAALDAREQASLRAAQRAWITYRDRACEAEAEPYRGRSGAGLARLACLEVATRHRTAFMKTGLFWQVEKAAE